MLIDTHFHLDLHENMRHLIDEFSNQSNIGIIAVGTTPKAYEKEVFFCKNVASIKVGLGLHPQLIGERIHELELILTFIKKARFIGEIGLDFNSAYIRSEQQQIDCFRKIVKACAKEQNKVLSIHAVKSVTTILDELETAGTVNNCICILHWFSGTPSERKRAIDDGMYFSINPRMLKTKSGQETIKAIPKNRLLLETDSPFTMKFNHVSDLKDELNKIIETISDIRNENDRKIIEDNSEKIWDIR